MSSVSCPHCAKPVTVPEGMGGKQMRCPSCRKVFPIGAEAGAGKAAATPAPARPSAKLIKPSGPSSSGGAAPARPAGPGPARPPAGPVVPGPPLMPRPSSQGLSAQPAPAPSSGPVYPHIDKPAGQPARLVRIPNIRVAQIVMDYLAFGWSPEEMCRQHPHLAPADVHAAMGYYYDYRVEIEQEIMNELNQVSADQAKAMPSAALLRLRAS